MQGMQYPESEGLLKFAPLLGALLVLTLNMPSLI